MPRAKFCLVACQVGSFSDTPRATIYLVIWRVGSLSYTSRTGICLVIRQVGSLFYTTHRGICLVVRRGWGVGVGGGESITRPVMQSVSFGSVGSFSYTPLC